MNFLNLYFFCLYWVATSEEADRTIVKLVYENYDHDDRH